jgi:hypothetical protein
MIKIPADIQPEALSYPNECNLVNMARMKKE